MTPTTVRPVARLGVPKGFDHRADRVVPAGAPQAAVPPQERRTGAVRGTHRFVLRESLRAEGPGVDRVVHVAAHAHGASFLHADEHAAADGAVAAGGPHPAIGNLARRGVPHDRIRGIGVVRRERIEAEEALDVHAAALPRYAAVMCRGTAVTKKR